ncbi:hypothetical protein TNCV_473261 [Trichonephila clavipes]|nr:hypothetical protein TNCV_473261 [Trichonephila clavipes]
MFFTNEVCISNSTIPLANILPFQKFFEYMKKPETHYLPSNVLEIDNYDRGGWIVCEKLMLDGLKLLNIFARGTVTVVRHRD